MGLRKVLLAVHEKGRKKLDRKLWRVPKKERHQTETSTFTHKMET